MKALGRDLLVPPLAVQAMPDGRLTQPIILIYGLADALAAASAAAALDLPVTLRIPADVAAALGADVIGRLFALVRTEVPHARLTASVDCADAPGLALALLRRGIDRVRVEGAREMQERVADIASQTGGALDDARASTLDLLTAADPKAACAAWLSGFKAERRNRNCL